MENRIEVVPSRGLIRHYATRYDPRLAAAVNRDLIRRMLWRWYESNRVDCYGVSLAVMALAERERGRASNFIPAKRKR